MPHPRADVFLDKRFEDEGTTFAQAGFAQVKKSNKPIVYYDGGKFPFNDKEFDYVICSHVIEHVPLGDLETFISEMQRVAYRGYIEFPNIFYELINYQDVHIWFMNYKDNNIWFLAKEIFKSNYVHKALREMFYGADSYMQHAFLRYKEFFFCGFEWNAIIYYRIVSSYDELVDESDYQHWKNYFSVPRIDPAPINQVGLVKQLYRKFRRVLKWGIKRVAKLPTIFGKPATYHVDKTAQLSDRRLIQIGEYAEIKDYVIIRTYSNVVKIGKYTQINPFTVIYGGSGVFIGDNVLIAPHCVIAAGNHDYKQTEKPMRFAGDLSKGPIIIEDDVWIGANCTITDGLKISRGAVVAANSVVTKDIAPYDIVAGVPARVIGNRKSNNV
jgi:acetyltransferase-like isoleucine patch superfamily enzyme/predicted SAM-dependent methyltransferase